MESRQTFEQKIEYIEQKRGRNHPLPLFRKVLNENLVIPKSRMIQIAGTNGKGSVVSWLSSFLRMAGFSVGTFTSPHLISHLERIAINGEPITKSDWEEIYDQYEPLFEKEEFTMFEIDLFMAVKYFEAENPDFILMEVGMGGQRDATTALDYEAGVITNIGLDHMAFLGNTVEEIALTKAGIIKEKMKIISSEKRENLIGLFDSICQEKKASFYPLFPLYSQCWHSEPVSNSVPHANSEIKPSVVLSSNSSSNPYSKCARDETFLCTSCPLAPKQIRLLFEQHKIPDYQIDNFYAAWMTLKALDIDLSALQLQTCIEHFSWKGRFTILKEKPLIVLDGAHNEPGILALCQNLDRYEFSVVYFSVLADKQAGAMIESLLEKVENLILVEFDSYRIGDLEQIAKRYHLQIVTIEQMLERIKNTKQNTLICGSLYFAGEVLKKS